jgi:hypothetical protein
VVLRGIYRGDLLVGDVCRVALEEREMRLKVSADIVSQLYNSYVTARAKALDAIQAHNDLAKRYNAKLLEIAAIRVAN